MKNEVFPPQRNANFLFCYFFERFFGFLLHSRRINQCRVWIFEQFTSFLLSSELITTHPHLRISPITCLSPSHIHSHVKLTTFSALISRKQKSFFFLSRTKLTLTEYVSFCVCVCLPVNRRFCGPTNSPTATKSQTISDTTNDSAAPSHANCTRWPSYCCCRPGYGVWCAFPATSSSDRRRRRARCSRTVTVAVVVVQDQRLN